MAIGAESCSVYPPDWHSVWRCPMCRERSGTFVLDGRTNTGRIAETVTCASCKAKSTYYWLESLHHWAMLANVRIKTDGRAYRCLDEVERPKQTLVGPHGAD